MIDSTVFSTWSDLELSAFREVCLLFDLENDCYDDIIWQKSVAARTIEDQLETDHT